MLPIAGSFVKGLAGVAVVFLDNLERLAKNKEDIQVLARDITDVAIIVRDASIKISAEPRGIEDVADLKNACSEFQKFLSDLTTKVIDIERSNYSLWKDIKKFLTSRDIKEMINGHRQVMEGARSNLLLVTSLYERARPLRESDKTNEERRILKARGRRKRDVVDYEGGDGGGRKVRERRIPN
ncbi:uncharacterized protein EV420DRAFT_1558617 [Desarmillaria tabescens]|uniref:Uncharacterized protein n=1 Tax=Armillaria tabescens TaxID=1929756 RepID=A0AA39N0N1_ARMTA|nr:uncharacterized protein EV420DRAFT_1558617 [Desarmillaria tabescens]KAK0452840.1 hypothetical protein EV420DRAFT_1558617 [Desarmillaria tabescens]